MPPKRNKTNQQQQVEDGENQPPPVVNAAAAAAAAGGPNKTQRRLVIRDIEVENFKSYAGRHSIGPFHKAVTCCIGCNGSGKSNQIDAMLFVFGKSARKIRVEGKLQDLIHNSAAYPNVPSASVTVNFVEIIDDPSDPYQREEVPNSKLSITREVSRTGSSQYFIDRARSTQREVVSLLLSKGVDLDHNRFLILQGEVEQIAMMKPKAEKEGEEGLVEYFDDLIGTNQYVATIDDASKRAAEAYENRLDMLSKLKNADEELAKVVDAKNQCMNYVTRDNDLHQLICVMSQISARVARVAMKEPAEMLDDVNEQILGKEKQMSEIQQQIKNLETQSTECVKAHQKFEAELGKVNDEKSTKEEELAAKKAAVDSQEKARKREQDKISKLRAEIEKLRGNLATAKNAEEGLVKILEDAQRFVSENQQSYEQQSDEVTMKLTPLLKQKEKVQKDVQPYERAMAHARSELEQLTENLRDLKAQTERHEKNRAESLNHIQQCEVRIQELDRKIEQTEANNNPQLLAERIAEVRAEMQQHGDRKSELGGIIEARKREAKESTTDDQVSSFLCSQRSLQGYIGPLRSLGGINDRFDIAAGVAGGNVWSFHVVEDPDTASEAMRLLREQNKGRASFIALSKVASECAHAISAPFQAPQGSERLYDLIECEDKVRPAFYFALRNTLVTNDLTRARELGLGARNMKDRFRVVTVDGGLVEPSGTLTGGGRDKPKGASLHRSTQQGGAQPRSAIDKRALFDQLTQLQSQMSQEYQAEQQARARLNTLENEQRSQALSGETLRSYRLQRSQLTSALENHRARLETIQRALSGQQQHQPQQHQTGGGGGRRIKQEQHQDAADVNPEQVLVQKITAAQLEFEEKSEQLKRHQVSLIQVEDQIKSVEGIEFTEFKKKFEHHKLQCRQHQQKLEDAKATTRKTESTIANKTKQTDDLEKKMADLLTEERERDKEAVVELQQALAVIDRRIASMKADAEENRLKLEDFKKKIDANKKNGDKVHEHLQEFLRRKTQVEEAMKPFLEKIGHSENVRKQNELAILENVKSFGTSTFRQLTGRGDDDDGGAMEDEMTEEQDEALAAFDMPSRNNNKSKQKKKTSASQKQKRRNFFSDEVSDDDDDDDDDDSDDDSSDDGGEKQQQGTQVKTEADDRLLDADSAKTKKNSKKNNNDSEQQQQQKTAATQVFNPDTFTTILTDAQLDTFQADSMKFTAQELHKELAEQKQTIDFDAVATWHEMDEMHRKIKEEHDEVLAQYNQARKEEETLKEERKTKFLQMFGVIQHKLKEVYQTITRCGDAELELVDSSDPFEGIRFTVRPPRKAWKAIGNLSGGEKTLSSLALVFALHHIKPTPVYVLDEIDAALDFRNVAIVGKYILERGIGAQFIIISLRNNMFELAHQLIGITKVKDCTRAIAISPKFLSDRISDAAHGRNRNNNQQNNNNRRQDPNSNNANAQSRHDYYGSGSSSSQTQSSQGGSMNNMSQPTLLNTNRSFKQHKADDDDDDE